MGIKLSLSDITRKKLSSFQIGHTVKESTREKISLSKKGNTIRKKSSIDKSIETRRINKENGIKLYVPWNKGKKMPKSAVEKRVLAMKGKPWSELRRKAYEEQKKNKENKS